jgi:hypothetical protein
MLEVKVVSRIDLSQVIERQYIEHHDCTLRELLTEQCPAYRPDIVAYLSVYVDGVKFPQSDWHLVKLHQARKVLFVLEAGGLEIGTIISIISIVLAVGSAVYGIMMANRLSSATQGETKQGSSIYDVNAQGNKVSLTKVIPENFGFFKHFPDYLADKHVFYRNNTQFVDMILCQGVGYYQRKEDSSDVYVGETPISELQGCQIAVFEPGTVITAENSIEDKCWYCYYSSTEVTPSGHTLEPNVTEIDQSSQQDSSVTFSDKSFSGGYYTSQQTDGGTQGPGSIRLFHQLDLKWDTGSYFTISGSNNTRLIGTSDSITDDAVSGTSEIIAEMSENFSDENIDLHKSWLRARVTEGGVITSAGDSLKITVRKKTIISYTIQGGTSGPQIKTAENSAEITSVCELLAVSYSGDDVSITVDSLELQQGNYPAAPSAPSGAYNVQTSYAMEVIILQSIPADYPYSDNGLYVIDSHDSATGTYTVSRVNSSYAVLSDWHEFWGQGVSQTSLTFNLDESSSNAGAFAGPFRACPYGAESSIFEYDISFPQGLGYLQDNGTFRDLTVQIEIGYRKAGSNDPWITETKTFTEHTNDELAFTYQLETSEPGNYEFRMRNLSEEDNSTRALNTVKWIGLKSVISTVNKYDDVTVIIGRFKGTETLSELSENQIATYWTRKLPDIYSGTLTPTRDLAPVVKYICNKSKYTGIINDSSLAEYDAFWNDKGITLDGTIDSDSTLLDCLKDCLNTGFASPVILNNKLSFTRLHKRGIAEPLTQIFTPQNLTASPKITFNLPKDDDVDEVVVDYTSPDTYKTETLFCHVDSDDDAYCTAYPLSVYQEKLKAFGVTKETQAKAMGMRRLRYLRSTRVTYEIQTEYDGLNCQFNDLVGLVLDENLSNITGRILSFDADTLTVETDQQIKQTHSSGIIYIRKLDGSCDEYTFTRTDSHHLVIDRAMPAWNDEFGSSLEYPFFAIGELVVCWVTAVTPQDKTCNLKLINYSEDIFADDLPISGGYGIEPYGIRPYGI